MTLTRSELLARAGLAAGAAALVGGGVRSAGATAPPRAVATDDWDAVRGQFALRPDVHHLAGFVLAPHPAVVRAAIARHRDALDADPVGYLHERQDELEGRVRAEAAGYLGGAPGEIALTDSTTMGLGLVYGGVRLPPGSEVLTSVHDFYATHEALRLRAARGGVRVRRIRLYSRPERASVDAIVSAVRTSSSRAPTSGLPARAGPGSSGPAPACGRACAPRCRRSTTRPPGPHGRAPVGRAQRAR